MRFKTQPDTPDTFRVAVVGDSGFGEEVTRRLGALMATYAPDFVIHTGDLVYNLQENSSPEAGFQTKLFLPFGQVMRLGPFYPTLGNHDLEDAAMAEGEPYGLTAFEPFIDPALPGAVPDSRGWYAFVQRGIQFVFLNSQVAFGYPGKSEETAWLEARLADPSVRASIVVLHVPLFNSGRHTLESVPVRQAWGEVIQSANVPLVLSGHDHNYQRFEEQGKTYLISGGGSSHLYQVVIPNRNLQAWAVKHSFRAAHFQPRLDRHPGNRFGWCRLRPGNHPLAGIQRADAGGRRFGTPAARPGGSHPLTMLDSRIPAFVEGDHYPTGTSLHPPPITSP